MNLLEDVRNMKGQGMTEDQIIQIMRDKGVQYRDISEALTQTQIKAAVEQRDEPQIPYQEQRNENELQPSLLQSPQAPEGFSQQPQQAPSQEQYYQPYQAVPAYTYDNPEGYAQYNVSADMITEISEQVVAEKISDVRKSIEKVIDFKTTVDAKIEFIDERLKRIEKAIDTLQTSVLRKVGDYVTNIEDIKRELVETQKTFTKLSSGNSHNKKSEHHH